MIEEKIIKYAKSQASSKDDSPNRYILISEYRPIIAEDLKQLALKRHPDCQVIITHQTAEAIALLPTKNWQEIIVGKSIAKNVDEKLLGPIKELMKPIGIVSEGIFGQFIILFFIKIAYPILIPRAKVMQNFDLKIKDFATENKFTIVV